MLNLKLIKAMTFRNFENRELLVSEDTPYWQSVVLQFYSSRLDLRERKSSGSPGFGVREVIRQAGKLRALWP